MFYSKVEIIISSDSEIDIRRELIKNFVEGIFKVKRTTLRDQGFVLQDALVLLFYMESKKQGAWNDNFTDGIAFGDKQLTAWKGFMQQFRGMAKEAGWPYISEK